MFARMSNWSALKKRTTTTWPSHTVRQRRAPLPHTRGRGADPRAGSIPRDNPWASFHRIIIQHTNPTHIGIGFWEHRNPTQSPTQQSNTISLPSPAQRRVLRRHARHPGLDHLLCVFIVCFVLGFDWFVSCCYVVVFCCLASGPGSLRRPARCPRRRPGDRPIGSNNRRNE